MLECDGYREVRRRTDKEVTLWQTDTIGTATESLGANRMTVTKAAAAATAQGATIRTEHRR